MPRQIEVMGQGMVEFPDSMTDDQILSVLNKERMTFMKNFAPGVDKPGLPAGRPEYQGMDYGSELPIPSDNFMTSGISQIGSGAAKMTRPGIAPKLGGASDIFRGATTAASPVMAAALPIAAAAAPVMTGAGLLAGYGGGKVARSTAESMTDSPDIQNFSEDLGGLLAGAGGAYLGNRGASSVSSIRHKFADANVQDALLRTLPKGKEAIKLRDAWRGVDSPVPVPVAKPAPKPPNAVRQEIARARGLMGEAEQAAPTPPIPVQTQTPSGRKPGGIFNQGKEPTPAEIIARQEEALRNVEAFKARHAAKPAPMQPTAPTPKPTAPSENAAARMAAQDAAGQPRTGLMPDVVAEAEKRGAWNVNAGNKGEMLTKLKQDALLQFAEANNLPKVALTEHEYNALVTAFNQTKPVHPVSGKPWKISPAGANNSATGYGRDAETTLRHFNNMRLGKK